MHRQITVGGLVALFVLILLTGYVWTQFSEVDRTRIVAPNGVELTATLVQSVGDRAMGLSNRDSLAYNEGMLFVFSDDEKHGIWMKDMRFSIDIIWLDEKGEVVSIETNASPESYPKVFRPTSPARYVLEVNAGWAQQNNIDVKTKLNLKL